MKGDIRAVQDEMRLLAARQDSLLTELRAQTVSAQDTLRAQSEAQADEMFDFRGSLNQSIRQMTQSLARLEALAGENQRSIAQVRDQLAGSPRGMAAASPDELADSPARPGGSEQLLPGGAGNPEEVWQGAMDQYDRGSFNTASMAFQEFIAEYPNHELVPYAHFNVADILEAQDRPEDALEAFRRIPTLFPTSEWVPTAMIRSALLMHSHLGDTDGARALLERVMNTYPGTPAAALARQALEEIG